VAVAQELTTLNPARVARLVLMRVVAQAAQKQRQRLEAVQYLTVAVAVGLPQTLRAKTALRAWL
jgi:hypothetical protein